MSANRVHRLLRMIALLQSGRPFTADQLAEEVAVSRRTLFRDLNMLELAGVPCRYDVKRRTYTVEPSFFLPSLNLSLEEALAILLVARRFVSRQSLPMYEPAARAATKIESSLPESVRAYCHGMLQGVTVKMPPLVDAFRAEEVFRTLHTALGVRCKVEIDYDSYFETRPIRTLLWPYQLTFVERAWHVIGHSELHDEVRTFKLDRIVRAKPQQEHYEPDPSFRLDDYLGLAWGLIPEGTIYHVRLRFLPKVAGSVEEIRWHKTQRFTAQPDGSCIFEAQVDGLNEITWWVLGYGDQVVVEEPAELRDRIGQIARNMCNLADAPPTA